MARGRDTVESLKADNQLFTRNNAGFLRRLLHIAAQKKENWWYVSKVMEDEKARTVLEGSAPRDEMQYYEGLLRQGVEPPSAPVSGVMPPSEYVDNIDISDDGGEGDADDGVISDNSDGDDEFEAATHAALQRMRQPTSPDAPQRRRPHTAGTMRPPRPGSAPSTRHGRPPRARPSTATLASKQKPSRDTSRGATPRRPSKLDFAVASGRKGAAMPSPAETWNTSTRPHSAGTTREVRGVLAKAVPLNAGPHQTPGCVPPRLDLRPRSAGTYKAKVVVPQQQATGAAPPARQARPHSAPHSRVPLNFQYKRRPSDEAHFKDQPTSVKLAAGLMPSDGEEKSVGHCWEDASGAIVNMKETVERVDVLIGNTKSKVTDEMRDKETAMDEEFALRDIGRLPENEYVSDVSSESSGKAESDEEFMRAKIQRQRARRDAKLAKKLDRRKAELREEHDLPYGVEERPKAKESPVVVTLKAQKSNGAPAPPAGAPATVSLDRRASLHGGSHVFTEKGDSTERARRWRPCFDALTVVERSIMKMEKSWKRHNSEKGEEELDHPPVVSERDKETFLSEGLGQENDEIAGVLTLWVTDMQQRLKVLDTYERIQAQSKVNDIDHAACQTDESYEPLNPNDGGNRPRRQSATPPPITASLLKREATSAFQISMIRVTAAIRIQSVWRAYFRRTMVGNFNTGLVTFFHSRDPRIREAWTQCAYVPPTKPASWLSSLIANILNSKIAANFVADSQYRPRTDFINYIFEYLYESLQVEEVVQDTLHQMLVLLNRHVNDDLLFAIVCNLLYCTWGPGYGNLLSYGMCCVHATVNKLPEINTTKPNCVLDVDVFLTSAQIKAVAKSVFNPKVSPRATAIHEEVQRKCRIIENTRRTKAANAAPQSPGAAPAASGNEAGQGQASVGTSQTVSQKEMLYAMLITATPDVLVEFGYDTQEHEEGRR